MTFKSGGQRRSCTMQREVQSRIVWENSHTSMCCLPTHETFISIRSKIQKWNWHRETLTSGICAWAIVCMWVVHQGLLSSKFAQNHETLSRDVWNSHRFRVVPFWRPFDTKRGSCRLQEREKKSNKSDFSFLSSTFLYLIGMVGRCVAKPLYFKLKDIFGRFVSQHGQLITKTFFTRAPV